VRGENMLGLNLPSALPKDFHPVWPREVEKKKRSLSFLIIKKQTYVQTYNVRCSYYLTIAFGEKRVCAEIWAITVKGCYSNVMYN
jgi:hypothetical protein